VSGHTLFPVIEFRPLPGYFVGPVRRFANGQWIPDDGEYDLAFICALGAPTCLMFEHSYQRNIVAQWLDGDWRGNETRHPEGNPWHYVLREGEAEWGGDWGRDQHPNTRAGRSGMDKLASERGCANGRHINNQIGDAHIAAGLVRERDSGNVVTFVRGACMYCGDSSADAIRKATE